MHRLHVLHHDRLGRLQLLAGTELDILAAGFVLPAAQGTYFQLLDFSAFAPADDLAFAERLLTEGGVASIPLSPFYEVPQPLPFVRLCIAKKDSTLDEAAVRLNAFASRLGGAPR